MARVWFNSVPPKKKKVTVSVLSLTGQLQGNKMKNNIGRKLHSAFSTPTKGIPNSCAQQHKKFSLQQQPHKQPEEWTHSTGAVQAPRSTEKSSFLRVTWSPRCFPLVLLFWNWQWGVLTRNTGLVCVRGLPLQTELGVWRWVLLL